MPTLDGVAFIDPKRSEIDIAQAVGRAIRLADGKTIGTIVIPVFIDTDEPNPDVVLDDSAFKPVWDVLLALRSHDEELAQQLDDLRRMLGRPGRGSRGPLRLPPKIHVDIPNVCGVKFARAFDVRLVEQTTASWEFWFGLLERYIRENGNALVPAKSRFHGHKLGAWVNEQRACYMEGTLAAERISRLNDLDDWTWDARDAEWEQGYRLLEEYIEQKGNALVPITYRTANGFKLGQWVSVQRTTYAKGNMPKERIERLKKLPNWTWNAQDYLWEEGFRHLEEYIQTHGDAVMPLKYRSDDGYPLGYWVNTQRVAFGRGTLRPDREQRLRQLPEWSWSAKDSLWEEGFSRLLRYIEVYDHANVPQKYVDADGYPLGSWCTTQRVARKKPGGLKPEREERLSALSGWDWNPRRGPRNRDEG